MIAGATGMIGSCLVDYLMFLNEHYSADIIIYAMNRNRKNAEERFLHYLSDSRFHLLSQDVTVPIRLDTSVDYIVHAATNAHPEAYSKFPVDIMRANFDGTYHMLDYLAHCGKGRLLLVSSGEVYGQSIDDRGFDESSYGFIDPIAARSCYPISKLAAETLCICFLKQYGVETVIVRPSHIYGPTSLKSDTRAVSTFLDDARNHRDIVMKSAGTQVRNYCYVFDCVEAILCSLLYGENGNVYNIADEQSVLSIREMAEQIAELGGVRVVMETPDEVLKSGFTSVTRGVVNAQKLKKLGWEASVHFLDGCRETLDILRTL